MYVERKQAAYRYEVYMLLSDRLRKKLKSIMIVQDVSARQLARVAGYASHSYMNRLLSGDARWLEVEPAVKIATFLGVEVTDLFIPKGSTVDGRAAKRQATRQPMKKAS